MPNISLNQYPYSAEQQAIERRRQLAQALQQQAFQPIEQPTIPGANASWTEVLAKALQGYASGRAEKGLDTQQQALDSKVAAQRAAMAQSLAGAATPPVTQSQDIVTPGGTLPVTLPPGPNDEQQRMATVMQGATSGDPIIQQLAAAIMGQQSKRQDIAQEFQGRKDLASYEAQLKEPLTTAQMNELNAQADKLRRPEEYTLNPGDVRFQGTNPVASVAPKPVVP